MKRGLTGIVEGRERGQSGKVAFCDKEILHPDAFLDLGCGGSGQGIVTGLRRVIVLLPPRHVAATNRKNDTAISTPLIPGTLRPRTCRLLLKLVFVTVGFAGVVAANAQPDTFLDRIDRFIIQQMTNFDSVRPTSQEPLIQTYAGYDPTNSDAYYRGDIYDQSVAICYLLERGQTARGRELADAILFLQKHDQIPDGHLHAAYCPTNLLDATTGFTSVKDPAISAGNMSWAGIALARTFVVTGDSNYLGGALQCANWIRNNLRHDDGPGGFSWGIDTGHYASQRSTEHGAQHRLLCLGDGPLRPHV